MDDFSSIHAYSGRLIWAISYHNHFPSSRIEMSPEDAQHLWAKEFQDCNNWAMDGMDVTTHSGDT